MDEFKNNLKIPFGKTPAVLVVDFQNGLLPAESASKIPIIFEVLANTKNFLKEIRKKEIPVFHTSLSFKKDLSNLGGWKYKYEKYMSPLIEGTTAVETHPDIYDPSDVSIFKQGPSAFFDTNLNDLLKAKEIDTLLICGTTTSGCVRATVTDAFALGYRTFVISDCVGDKNLETHTQSLKDMSLRYADVILARKALDSCINKSN